MEPTSPRPLRCWESRRCLSGGSDEKLVAVVDTWATAVPLHVCRGVLDPVQFLVPTPDRKGRPSAPVQLRPREDRVDGGLKTIRGSACLAEESGCHPLLLAQDPMW